MSSVLYPGFVEEIVDLLQLENNEMKYIDGLTFLTFFDFLPPPTWSPNFTSIFSIISKIYWIDIVHSHETSIFIASYDSLDSNSSFNAIKMDGTWESTASIRDIEFYTFLEKHRIDWIDIFHTIQ